MPFQSLLLLGNSFFVCHHKMGDVLKLEMEFPNCSKDASSLAKRVSLLNFEPRSQNFLWLERLMPFQSLLLLGNSFLFVMIRWWRIGVRNGISKMWQRTQAVSQKRVSLLNFEPRVSNFIWNKVPKRYYLCYNWSEKRTKECRGGSQSCQRWISSTI